MATRHAVNVLQRVTRRIVHIDLNSHSGDYQEKNRFCEDVLGSLEKNDDQVSDSWMSGKTHFGFCE